MDAATIAPFLVFQTFFGLASSQHAWASRADIVDLSGMEVMLWRSDTLAATVLAVELLAARVNGIAFLLFVGYRLGLASAAVLLAAGLAMALGLGPVLRRVSDNPLPALVAYAVLPLAGVWMWVSAP